MEQRHYNPPNETKPCLACGQNFGPSPWDYQSKWDKKVTCSPKCAAAFRGAKRRIHKIRPCLTCGTDFTPRMGGRNVVMKYCSRPCYYQSKIGKATWIPPKLPRTQQACEGCGTTMNLLLSEIQRGRRFCSKACLFGWMGRRAPDEPGLHQAFYHSPLWRALRRYVFLRDNKTCQRCGHTATTQRYMRIHHLAPRTSFVPPSGGDDPHNLVTLCFRCHMQVHYGPDTDAPDNPFALRRAAKT